MKAILPNGSEVDAERVGLRYHGMTIPPTIAFISGIPAKGEDRRLLEHV